MQGTLTRTGKWITVGIVDNTEYGPFGPYSSEARADERGERFIEERAHLQRDHYVEAVSYELAQDEDGALWRT